MAYSDTREEKWRGNWRMEWVASTLHTTSELGVSSITTADTHTSAANSRLNWRPRRFKWTRPFRRKTKYGFCACAITFHLASASFDCFITTDNFLNSLTRGTHFPVYMHVLLLQWTEYLDSFKLRNLYTPNGAVWQQERSSRLADASLSVTAVTQQLTQSVAMFWAHYSARLSVVRVSCLDICFTILVGAKILYSTQTTGTAVILRSVCSRPYYFCQQAVVSTCT
jgi:hypothetical protein